MEEERLSLTKPITRKDWRFLLVSSLIWAAVLILLLSCGELAKEGTTRLKSAIFGSPLCACEEASEGPTPEEIARAKMVLERAGVDFKR